MKPIFKIITLFFLSFLLSPSMNANNSIKTNTIMEDNVHLKINSLGLLHIAINELIADLNQTKDAKLQPIEGKFDFLKDSHKITEIGNYLKYNIVGTNDFIGCSHAFEQIVKKYYSDKNAEEKFYKRIDKIFKEEFK